MTFNCNFFYINVSFGTVKVITYYNIKLFFMTDLATSILLVGQLDQLAIYFQYYPVFEIRWSSWVRTDEDDGSAGCKSEHS
jgi:hypothetical protein